MVLEGKMPIVKYRYSFHSTRALKKFVKKILAAGLLADIMLLYDLRFVAYEW